MQISALMIEHVVRKCFMLGITLKYYQPNLSIRFYVQQKHDLLLEMMKF